MNATPERLALLEGAVNRNLNLRECEVLQDFYAECKAELAKKPLVFEMAHGFKDGNSFTDQFTIKFNRYLTRADFDAVCTVLSKAFP